MKSNFGFIDPGAIMGVIVALIILGVGIFTFYIVITSMPWARTQVFTETPTTTTLGNGNYNASWNLSYNRTIQIGDNVSGVGTQVFNIVGIIMIIGAIMAIVGLVYNYVR